MKLTVDRIVNELGDVAITIDGYVPVDVKLIDSQKLPPLYWRVGNGERSLLELAVLPENGLLSSITLVMIELGSIHKTDSLPVHFSNCVRGLPVVNTELWKHSGNDDFSQRFIDSFDIDIQVVMSSEAMLLIVGEDKNAANWIRCGDNFYLGMDDEKNIVNLFLDKLTQEEIENFFEAVS
ncbi:hypothetical protein J0B02_17585 [Enterobacteriaceae bacterium YMB-R22]|nr:hypothetical protein [Tenebrionicola larvae]